MGRQGMKLTLFMYFVFMALLVTVALTEAAVREATITLTPPMERTDGTRLPLSEIRHYLISISGPDGQTELVMTGTRQAWTPPLPGEYTLRAATVDTGGRTSDQTAPVGYLAVAIESRPNPPTLIVTLPLEAAIPAREEDGTITVDALSYLDLSPDTGGKNWEEKTVAGIKGLATPTDGVRLADYAQNARVDYLVEATGGTYSLIIHNYATNGLSDSVWVGQNGLPAPDINGGRPVFSVSATRGQWADTAPVAVTLPAGQSVITLFNREAGYVVSRLTLVKN